MYSPKPKVASGQPQSLRRVPLYQQVLDRLVEQMANGQLKEGDRLPNEDELAAQYGVSRTVVREAVGVLRQRGVLEVTPGRGTVIQRPSAAFVAEAVGSLFGVFGDAGFENYLEVRELLEQQIIRLAVERATAEDLRRIEGCLAITSDSDHCFDANLAFHVALAEATHNPLLATLIQALIGCTGAISNAVHEQLPEAHARTHAFHEEILDRLRARDRAGAEAVTLEHMAAVRRSYYTIAGKETTPE